MPPNITAAHRRRLREVWRSAGWPCQDMIELELLAAGLLERRADAQGRETVRVSDAGINLLAVTLQRNRAVRNKHEDLVERVAREMQRAGRIAWRGLSLRARVGVENEDARWVVAMPDVFSIRHTTVEAYLEPIVHEVKVNRADLLGDLRNAAKRQAYLQISGQCWYVLAPGIGDARDVPLECGVMLALPAGFEVLRPAPRRASSLASGLPFGTWVALARATPLLDDTDAQAQGLLGAPDGATDDTPPAPTS